MTDSASSLRNEHFISAPDLAQLIQSSRPPVLLDVRDQNGVPDGRPAYLAGHLPGAVYVDLPTQLQDQPHGFSGGRPLPEVADLQANARTWGIHDGDSVVVYDDAFGTKAGRAWFVLRWAGIQDVRLLDGAYRAWVDGGYPISTQVPTPASGDVTLSAGHLPTLEADDAAEHAARGTLFDARGASQYHAGHIPGARLAATSGNLTEAGLLKDEAALRQRFTELGIDVATPIGVYCGGGVAAAHELAVLTSLGIPATLYVGSFSAWSSDPSRPVEVSEPAVR